MSSKGDASDDELVITLDETETFELQIKKEPVDLTEVLQKVLVEQPRGSVFDLVNKAVHDQGMRTVDAIRTYQAYDKIRRQNRDVQILDEIDAYLNDSQDHNAVNITAVNASEVIAPKVIAREIIAPKIVAPEPEVVKKYGFVVKKRIVAPSSTATSSTPMDTMPPTMTLLDMPPPINQPELFQPMTRPTMQCTIKLKPEWMVGSGKVGSARKISREDDPIIPTAFFNPGTFSAWDRMLVVDPHQVLDAKLNMPISDVNKNTLKSPDQSTTFGRGSRSRSPSALARSRSPLSRSTSRASSRQWPKRCELTDEQKVRDRERRRIRVKMETRENLNRLQHVPKLARQAIVHPYQWVMPDETEDSNTEEELDDLYVRPARTVRWARSDASWRKIYHTDKTAREYAEWMISSRPPSFMQPLTLQNARDCMVKTYFVETKPTQLIFEFKEGTKVQDDHNAVFQFISEVTAVKFMSFDTEGSGKLPRKSGKNDRLFVALSCPKSAVVLLFHDADNIPQSLRLILLDFTIAKIQSGIGGDVDLMKQAGIDVRGVVDSGTLYMLVKPGPIDAGFGAGHQIDAIWPAKNCHQPYDYRAFGPAFNKQKLTTRTVRHVVQDVMTPFATLFKAAILQAEHLKYGENEDVMPLINEALELCYSKEPKDVRACSTSSSPHWYWLPATDGSEFRLNSRADITLIRRARGDLIEPFNNDITMESRKASARDIWSCRSIPGARDKNFKCQNLWLTMSKICQNCGGDHGILNCPTPFTPCSVPHYPKLNHPPHSTLMCPQIHAYCGLCKLRGHTEHEHGNRLEKSPRELREDFKKYCHLGLYTSLPFLYEHNGPIKSHHWKATLGATTLYRGQADLWLYAGLETQLPEEMRRTKQENRDRAKRNLTSTSESYQYAAMEKVKYED